MIKSPFEQNKKFWVHRSLPGMYKPQDFGFRGFTLWNSQRMMRFNSKSDALDAGWAEYAGQ